jgi:hypothetical protein
MKADGHHESGRRHTKLSVRAASFSVKFCMFFLNVVLAQNVWCAEVCFSVQSPADTATCLVLDRRPAMNT